MEVRWTERPSLKNPTFVAAWPGMGMLARMSVDYLVQQLQAKQFAEVLSPTNDLYFSDGVGEVNQFRHRFFYSSLRDVDLVLCSGEFQPQSVVELMQLGNKVLDVAEEVEVKRVFTFAAVPNPHDVKPRVVGVVNKPELAEFLREKNVRLVSGDGRITGLNGLLVGIARQRGIDGVCLLCEIRYLDIPQPRSAKAVLGVLARILGITLDLSELERQAEEIDEKLEKIRESRAMQEDRQREPHYIS